MDRVTAIVMDEDGTEVGRYTNVTAVAVQRSKPGTGFGLFYYRQGVRIQYENVRSAVLRLAALRDPDQPEKGCICVAVGPEA